MEWGLFFILYLISVPLFFLVDMLWLGVIARNFYQQQIGHLLGEVRWLPAVGFYLVYLLGLVFFAIYPAYIEASVGLGAVLGALFGFFTYATYDMTNLATLRGWPQTIVVVDIVWGTVLGTLVACGTVALALIII